ncbi:hypothetical protein KXV61_008544, partial [Aspergillus fumigatus]
RQDRSQPADEGHPGHLLEISDQDAGLDERHYDRGARQRPRQAARAAGEGRAAAGLFQESSGLLRRPGQDARGLRLRRVRSDHGGPHGFLRRPVPGRRRLDGDGGQGQPRAGGARGLQEIWRLLSRLDRRRRGESRRALHQEGRGARISRARHGSDLAHRS